MICNTILYLMAQHNGVAVIPLEVVAKEHFRMSEEALRRKIRQHQILPAGAALRPKLLAMRVQMANNTLARQAGRVVSAFSNEGVVKWF